jgi:hypothetical protein
VPKDIYAFKANDLTPEEQAAQKPGKAQDPEEDASFVPQEEVW